MSFVVQPWQLLLSILAGWINEKQQDYQRTENRVLRDDGQGILTTYTDGLRVLSDENHRANLVMFNPNIKGDTISYAADGTILDKTPNTDKDIVYLVDNDKRDLPPLTEQQILALADALRKHGDRRETWAP